MGSGLGGTGGLRQCKLAMPSMRPLIAPPAAISQRRPRLPGPGDISRPAPPNLIDVNLKHHAVTNPHDMGEVARAGDDRITAKSRHDLCGLVIVD